MRGLQRDARDGGEVIPFPLPLRAPKNEDDRLYMQAYRCLMAASWQLAIFRSTQPAQFRRVIEGGRVRSAMAALTFAEELIDGAAVYLQLRADLREQAVSA
jgi:hypothetical protein